MSCKVERYGEDAPEGYAPGMLKAMIFTCDFARCKRSPDDETIKKLGGLRNMGWYASGGQHFCPDHRPDTN